MKLFRRIGFERVWYEPPWMWTRWWWFHCRKGGDEWHNSSITLGLPLLGAFVIFYGRNFDRSTWTCAGVSGTAATYYSPDYTRLAQVMLHQAPLGPECCGNWPGPMTAEQVQKHAFSIEDARWG